MLAHLDERVVSASQDHTLRVWDLDSGEIIRTLNGHTDRGSAVAVLDEKRVVSASDDQTLRLWDLKSGATMGTPHGHTNSVTAMAVLDENRLLSESKDDTLRPRLERRLRRDRLHARTPHRRQYPRGGGGAGREARDLDVTVTMPDGHSGTGMVTVHDVDGKPLARGNSGGGLDQSRISLEQGALLFRTTRRSLSKKSINTQ